MFPKGYRQTLSLDILILYLAMLVTRMGFGSIDMVFPSYVVPKEKMV